jgi:hypothetical protein
VSTHCFVDADHAGNLITRRSQTGILLFVNRALIVWYSKRQNTVETSTFGSEFVAMRIAVELIESLRYKLRMFGIPIDGPTNVYCDNEAVTKNAIYPESTAEPVPIPSMFLNIGIESVKDRYSPFNFIIFLKQIAYFNIHIQIVQLHMCS